MDNSLANEKVVVKRMNETFEFVFYLSDRNFKAKFLQLFI
jgi:hypothetical protein